MPSNFITRHYVKSPALGGCSSSLLFEIIKKILIFVLSAWLGTEVHLSPGLAVIQELVRQGIAWLSWISFQNLEERVGSGYCYSCLSQKCVLVKIKYSSSHHALPNSTFACRSTLPVALLRQCHVAGKSLLYQVSFFLAMQFLPFCHIWVSNIPFVLQMASLLSEKFR